MSVKRDLYSLQPSSLWLAKIQCLSNEWDRRVDELQTRIIGLLGADGTDPRADCVKYERAINWDVTGRQYGQLSAW